MWAIRSHSKSGAEKWAGIPIIWPETISPARPKRCENSTRGSVMVDRALRRSMTTNAGGAGTKKHRPTDRPIHPGKLDRNQVRSREGSPNQTSALLCRRDFRHWWRRRRKEKTQNRIDPRRPGAFAMTGPFDFEIIEVVVQSPPFFHKPVAQGGRAFP